MRFDIKHRFSIKNLSGTSSRLKKKKRTSVVAFSQKLNWGLELGYGNGIP